MNANVSNQPNELKPGINGSIVVGILLILAGVAAIAFPRFSTLTAEIWVAWILVFSGVSKLVYAIQSRTEDGFVWKLLVSLLYIATGVFLLANPLQGVLTLTLTLGIFLLVEGIIEIAFAFQMRPQPSWLWLLGNGVTTLLLGGLIWAEWPLNGAFAIGLLVGISLLFSGFSRIALALSGRSMPTSTPVA